jgi:regulator of sirC expression with transglutaminase-like and TPR domain
MDPQDSNTYKSRGIIYYELGNFRQASSDFSSAIDYNPKDGESYLFRGNCSVLSG